MVGFDSTFQTFEKSKYIITTKKYHSLPALFSHSKVKNHDERLPIQYFTILLSIHNSLRPTGKLTTKGQFTH